jgi:hypothetical protein
MKRSTRCAAASPQSKVLAAGTYDDRILGGPLMTGGRPERPHDKHQRQRSDGSSRAGPASRCADPSEYALLCAKVIALRLDLSDARLPRAHQLVDSTTTPLTPCWAADRRQLRMIVFLRGFGGRADRCGVQRRS